MSGEALVDSRRLLGRKLQVGMTLGVLVCATLVVLTVVRFFGVLRVYGTGWTGEFGVMLILAVYGFAAWRGTGWTERRAPQVLPVAVGFGLAAGIIFAGEVVLEYVTPPANNSGFGLVEYGAVLLLYLAAGVLASLRTQRVRDGMLASVWSAAIAGIIWYAVLLITFNLFYRSPQQAHVLRAEGTLVDFSASGMVNFDAFVVEDFLGAGFFHLLLGPLIAAGLGAIGGMAGKIASNAIRR
jgi:hypothetical protein